MSSLRENPKTPLQIATQARYFAVRAILAQVGCEMPEECPLFEEPWVIDRRNPADPPRISYI